MLEPTKVRNEMKALQTHFRDKRDYVVQRLTDMGFTLDYTPDSTFYLWLNLEELPREINDGLKFFHACLEEKVIVVPGLFFDLNPAKRRDLFDSPCHHFVRVSYGPKLDTLKMGMDGIERILKKHGAFKGKKERSAAAEEEAVLTE
jgi:aspartate/methionine/tyrosine aminotransferase